MGIEGYFAGLGPAFIVLFMAPFVLLLISLATLPLLFPHFWETNKNKAIVSLAFGLPVASFFMYKDWQTLANTALDYGAFISLLGALFIISGGIYIRGSFAGRPMVNTAFLVIGSVLANLIGTTGASMLLIRPLIRANVERQRKSHIIIFFIFIVSNGAGLLTPLGDPPLFLGFLRGVDFAWTLHLWPQWLTVVGALLVAFNLVDRHQFNKEGPATRASLAREGTQLADKFGIEGAHNLIFLSMVVGLIVFSGYVIYPLEGRKLLGESFGPVLSKAAQMAGMMLIALTSYQVTDKTTHHRHNFNFRPIVETAANYSVAEQVTVPMALWRERVDLFHAPHYVLPPLVLCRSVVTIHDCIHLMFPQYLPSRLAHLYAKASMWTATHQADRILTVSDASKRDILRFFDIPADKVSVIYNAIDERFLGPPDPTRMDLVRQRYQLGHPFVLYVGNIKPHKNVERLIDAFGRARGEGPADLTLVIIGDELSKYPALRQAVHRHKLDKYVRFLGFQPQETLAAFYRLARAFVFPSLYEGFGLPPLEAMACGTPVVTSNVSSLPGVAGGAALLVDPYDTDAVAEGIVRAVTDETLRADLITRGRSRAQMFSWPQSVAEIHRIYLQVAQR